MSFATFGRLLGFLFKTLLVAILGFVGWGFYLSWDVSQWDAKIDALCAANGRQNVAVRVYETATAPETKEYFKELPQGRSFFIPSRAEGESLPLAYPYVVETRVVEVLNLRDPSVVKYVERIVRVNDNKTLAEAFGYQRGGGGIPGFDPGEIRNCPADSLSRRLEVLVFLNHPLYNKLEQK